MKENLDKIVAKGVDITTKYILTVLYISWVMYNALDMYIHNAVTDENIGRLYLQGFYWLVGIGLAWALRDYYLDGYISLSEEELEKYPPWLKYHIEDVSLDGRVKVKRRVWLDAQYYKYYKK